MMSGDETIVARKERMGILARSSTARLHELWPSVGLDPAYKMLRGPEFGLLMLRGRVGGTGQAFNLGEATVTRASVKLEDGSVGHAMALGRDPAKAELSAVIDALCRNAEAAACIDTMLVDPIRAELNDADETSRCQTAATRVDFFTMVRGED
jgi:alpha-D-ribose 1-methylphosphonate 5-triphosphate synthase subunit PhnG